MNGDLVDDADAPENTRLRWLLGVAGLLFLAVVLVWFPGCRENPAVTSKESLQLIKLLYAACNAQDPVRLQRVEQSLETLSNAGKLSAGERVSFERIVQRARAGDWDSAEKAAYQFAADQIGQGSATAQPHDNHDHRPAGKGRAGK